MSGGDELREAVAALIAEDQAVGWQESLPAELAERIVALPELEAWAERRARERAAEELFVMASRLVAQDVKDMAVYDEIRALRDALAANALAADDGAGQQ